MSVENIYQEQKDNFIFKDSKKFSSLRNDIIDNFILSPNIRKNNESLKHIDPNILDFSYKYKDTINDIVFTKNQEDKIDIEIIDGKICNVDNKIINEYDLKINNINNKNDLLKNKFISLHNHFKNDYILNLNTLLLNSGYEILIEENQNISFFLSNNISDEGLTLFQKNTITCRKNTNVFIVEEFVNDKKSNNNIVNYIDIAEGSNLTHLILQKNNDKANLQSTTFVNCLSKSTYKQVILNLSQSSVRNHHYVNLNGENSFAELDGIFFGSKKQFIDNKTEINHNVPNCRSSQRYKGVITDQAKASYLSKTFVNKIAQKTEAYQLSKGILLSDTAYFHSKPELRIFADDVKCSHGSTIGPIDGDLLFYLRSRGLDKRKSSSLLIKSFFHDIILKIDDKILIEKFNHYLDIWLKENNI